ncbi:MAG: ATP-binding cassette domain-containing protein [Eubacterium sp.]|jgi:ABC-2 type transport system ATP-binding protein|nr:ATP-binding cassette domain-containing protein [Eubacterium sp.]
MLELKGVSKKFRKKQVLNNIDFKFEKGIYGILGPNGAGKTTLIRCITQLYNLDAGNILYNDKSIAENKNFNDNIGYLPQKFGLFKELTVFEMLSAMAALKNISKDAVEQEVKRCITLVNLDEKINAKVKTLSGGMIRRMGIAQAILGNPEIIIFDEPTSGLDPEERLRFKNIVSKLKGEHIIIISTHIVEDVEALCDFVVIMNSGQIIKSGSCSEIEGCAQNKVFELNEENSNLLNEPYHIQQQFEINGKRKLRVLSSLNIECDKITAVQPKVEDGYICLIKDL